MYVQENDLCVYIFTIKDIAWGGGQEKRGAKFYNHLFSVDCFFLE